MPDVQEQTRVHRAGPRGYTHLGCQNLRYRRMNRGTRTAQRTQSLTLPGSWLQLFVQPRSGYFPPTSCNL